MIKGALALACTNVALAGGPTARDVSQVGPSAGTLYLYIWQRNFSSIYYYSPSSFVIMLKVK